MIGKTFEHLAIQQQKYNKISEDELSTIKTSNFFDLDDKNLKVINQYDFDEALKSIDNLTEEEIKDSLDHFQKKNFQFKNKENTSTFPLDEVIFASSSKNDKKEQEYYLLNNLNEYLLSDEKIKDRETKKIILEIKQQQNGKKDIFIRCLVQSDKLSKNIIDNFLEKSPFEKAKTLLEDYKNNSKDIENSSFKMTIKIQLNTINKIYYNQNEGEFYFLLQNPPIFRTNFLISREDERENNACLFPFRNFEDEFSNLKYRNFVLLIKKKKLEDMIDADIEDSIGDLINSFRNLFNDRKGKQKFIKRNIILK